MGNVANLQPNAWQELVDLCRKEQKHSADARALWPQIAARMAQLRRNYKSDNEFGAELMRHSIEYGKDDRAAFIWMGSLKPEALEDALAACDRRTPRYFRIEVESWEDPYFEPVSLNSETIPEHAGVPESAGNATCAVESEKVEIQKVVETDTLIHGQQWDARSKLFPMGESGKLLQAMIGGNNASGAIYPLMLKQRKFLQFIADKIKDGVLHPGRFNSSVFHAARLLPALDKSFVKEMVFSRKGEGRPNTKAIELFTKHFDLILRAAEMGWTYAEFLRATKGVTPATKPASAAEVWAQRPTTQPITEALPKAITLADGTELCPEPIYVCGQCLFPSEARKDLSYVDAYLHAHDCREWVAQMNDCSVQEVGLHLAHRGIQFGRQYEVLGKFLSAIGTAIRSRGEETDRALWFKLEPFRNRTSA